MMPLLGNWEVGPCPRAVALGGRGEAHASTEPWLTAVELGEGRGHVTGRGRGRGRGPRAPGERRGVARLGWARPRWTRAGVGGAGQRAREEVTWARGLT